MRLQGLLRGFTLQSSRITLKTMHLAEVSSGRGPPAATKLLSIIFPILLSRTKGLMSGEVSNETLLDIEHERYGSEHDDFAHSLDYGRKSDWDPKYNQSGDDDTPPWEQAYDAIFTEVQMFFEKYQRKGKCVYKQETGEKKGCSDTVAMAKKYVKALYANTDDIKEEIEEYFLREEDEEEEFNDVSTEDILDPTIPAPWETND